MERTEGAVSVAYLYERRGGDGEEQTAKVQLWACPRHYRTLRRSGAEVPTSWRGHYRDSEVPDRRCPFVEREAGYRLLRELERGDCLFVPRLLR